MASGNQHLIPGNHTFSPELYIPDPITAAMPRAPIDRALLVEPTSPRSYTELLEESSRLQAGLEVADTYDGVRNVVLKGANARILLMGATNGQLRTRLQNKGKKNNSVGEKRKHLMASKYG